MSESLNCLQVLSYTVVVHIKDYMSEKRERELPDYFLCLFYFCLLFLLLWLHHFIFTNRVESKLSTKMFLYVFHFLLLKLFATLSHINVSKKKWKKFLHFHKKMTIVMRCTSALNFCHFGNSHTSKEEPSYLHMRKWCCRKFQIQ